MKAVTARRMKELDALAIRRYGIPALLLMENAGRSAAEEALEMLPKKGLKSAALVCGYGNNGGDGFVCARHLLNKGVGVRVYLVGKKKPMSPEARLNYEILRKMTRQVFAAAATAGLAVLGRELKKYRLIIDGIFGIGLKGEPGEFYQRLFAAVNDSGVPVLSLDIPSGLDADTGRPLGNAIRAARTITFGFLKKGLVLGQARSFTGRVVVGDISLPPGIIREP